MSRIQSSKSAANTEPILAEAVVPSGIARWLELPLACVALIAMAPLFGLVALLILLDSPGSVLFRQPRVGRRGHRFTLYKFRTMHPNAAGPQITPSNDRRVTRVGRFLRRFKLDELPSLLNVVRGDLSIVGPRPEVPSYVDMDSQEWRAVLMVRPGITDPVTLVLRNEEALLESVAEDREDWYRQYLVPYKLFHYRQYLAIRTGWTDIAVILKTLLAVGMPRRTPPPTASEIVAWERAR